MMSLWKTVWRVLKKLRTIIWPSYSILGIYLKNMKTPIWKYICTLVFIAALFTITKLWKWTACTLTDEWINKMRCIYTMGYYSVIKKKTWDSSIWNMDLSWKYWICQTVHLDFCSILEKNPNELFANPILCCDMSEKNKYAWFYSYIKSKKKRKNRCMETDIRLVFIRGRLSWGSRKMSKESQLHDNGW